MGSLGCPPPRVVEGIRWGTMSRGFLGEESLAIDSFQNTACPPLLGTLASKRGADFGCQLSVVLATVI